MRTTLQTALLAALFSGIFHVSLAQVAAQSGGSISGILVGKDGAPLGGVRVTAMAVPDPAAADTETSVLVSLAQTDSQGRYLLENVPPGRYYITAGFLNLPTYYPGTTARLNATAVEVRAGETRSGLNFSAASPSSIGGAINGRVALSDFPGAQRVHLQGRGLSAATGISSLDTLVRDDGTFAFPPVPAGSYTLRVFGPGNVLFGSVTTTAEVNDRDVDVQVTSPIPFLVGRIVTEDGSPLPPVPREANSQTLAVTSQSGTGREATGIQSGGMFVLRRQVEMKIGMNSLPLGYTIKSISYAGRNLAAGSLKFDGPPFGELLITLEFKRAEDVVGVRVRGRAINIPTELFVRKTPMVRLTYTGGPLLETPLNRNGSFEFQKVPPGTYTLFFLSGAGRLSTPPIIVSNSDIQDVEIDLRNNPFPEFPVGSFAAVFDSRQMTTLHGVITQGITQIRPPVPTYYFRMDADPDGTGRTEHWGIMLSISSTPGVLTDPNMAALKPGARITVVVNTDRDGSPRGFLVPQAGANTPVGIVVDAP